MICNKCKTEIKDGYMYCPKCGEEVIMVPDYEVEIEEGIEKTISEVAENIAVDLENQSVDESEDELIRTEDSLDKSGSTTIDDKISGAPIKKNKKIGPILIAAIVLIIGSIICVVIFNLYTLVNNYFSYDKQYAKAMSEYDAGIYDDCVSTLKHVVSLDRTVEAPRIMLADSYYKLEKYDESIAVLNDLLNDFPDDVDIYERLITNYELEGDISSIIALSQACNNVEILRLFDEYVSAVPEFSISEGNYYETQSLSLIAEGNGEIYYTVDGSEPTTNSSIYKSPIKLEQGETVVTAVHINEKGISSNSVSKTYNIEILLPKAPKLLTQAGDYTSPRLIKLEDSVEGTIYYTTDGSDPTVDSKEYDPPIAMPLGKSEYRFAVINNQGISSEIINANYNLNIAAIIDTTTAEATVQFYQMSKGENVLEREYTAVSGYSIGSRNYYFVEEYDISSGKKVKLNTTFAVDAQTSELFTVTRNSNTGDFDFGACM